MTLQIRASATVVQGVKTGRVKVKRRAASAGTALKAYRKDPTIRGLDYARLCITMPVAELEAMDALAARSQMARSHLIRQAVKHFAAKVLGER